MRFVTLVSAFLSLAACASAANITVKVAEGGALTFTPNSVNATEGDVIAFQFLTGNHTVTQSSFADPCTRLSTPSLGIDSGFQPVSSNATTVPEYSFTVDNATTPLWFYCKQGNHCKEGMVFAVNPTANNTFDAFKDKATGNSSSSNSSSSSLRPSSTGSGATPSATNRSGALGLNPSLLAGIITLVAVFTASFL